LIKSAEFMTPVGNFVRTTKSEKRGQIRVA
jgi:hypothetical protein